jgi:hypothetical protein
MDVQSAGTLRYLFVRSGGVSPTEAIISAQTLSELILLTLVMGMEIILCVALLETERNLFHGELIDSRNHPFPTLFVQPNPVRKGWHALFRWLIPALLSDFYSDIRDQK